MRLDFHAHACGVPSHPPRHPHLCELPDTPFEALELAILRSYPWSFGTSSPYADVAARCLPCAALGWYHLAGLGRCLALAGVIPPRGLEPRVAVRG